MGIFAGEHGARTTIGAYPCTTVARLVGYLQEALPTGILRTLLVRTLRNAGVQVFLHHTGIEARNDINGRRVGNLFSLTCIITLSTLVMNGTCGVELMEPCGHGSLIRSIATLVAQTPEDDAGVVLVALSHADGPIQEGIAPVGGGS